MSNISDFSVEILVLLASLNLVAVLALLFRGSGKVASLVEKQVNGILTRIDGTDKRIQESLSNARSENFTRDNQNRREWRENFDRFADSQRQTFHENNQQLQALKEAVDKRLESLSESSANKLSELTRELVARVERMEKSNLAQLERMRETVDEKLHKTLEERLGRSFKLVQDSLEKVQLGLGEMQQLATGVGDLKKVLSNVKTRGVLGEIQLGNILEELLTAEQYGVNVATIPNSANHVEFAIRMPGSKPGGNPVWLPIDSKFPMDKYEQVLQAYELGDKAELQAAHKELSRTVRAMAKDIRDKYVSPPHTTDFGLMFLPIEGLYAELAREPGLLSELQRDYRILIAGPSNLAAFLNSLQMGFRSLAIEKRSSEVWQVLGQVKTEFKKFGDVMVKVKGHLQKASATIDTVDTRTRVLERKLKDVEELPSAGDDFHEKPEGDLIE